MPGPNDRDMSGILYKNVDKEKNPRWPDYKGKCTINGQLYYLGAWIKDGTKGKFLSISFSLPRDKQQPEQNQHHSEDIETLPF